MFDAYAPYLTVPAAGVQTIARDVHYGKHPRQVLDVHTPTGAHGLPVMIFVHGGAFFRGDKTQTGTIYGNVPAEFAQHGFVGINVEYRLAPDASWPAGAADVRDAVMWVQRHSPTFGGDSTRIFLFGHSAGCAHCATAVWDSRVAAPGGPLTLRGLILASPRVRADVRPENPNAVGVRAYYGVDESVYADRAPLSHVRPDAPPTFVALAQYENPLIDFYALELAHRLARVRDAHGGPMPRLVQYPDHNHVSLVAQFHSGFNVLGHDIRDWCSRVERGEFAAQPPLGKSLVRV